MDEITEFSRRKRDMMDLWKEIFHDSSQYINLVFNTYFSLDNTFVKYEGEKLVAALLGIPYTFQAFDKQGHKMYLKGFYLCGLATRPEWRRKGIMSLLMQEAEITAKARGYDMTFLIPADSHLREYYHKMGYYTASYRTRCILESPDNLPDQVNNKMYIYTIKDFCKNRSQIKFIEELAEWCSEIENICSCPSILHTNKDMLAIMAENENSFFLTDRTFDLEYPILAEVHAVVFPEEIKDNSKRILRIVGYYSKQEVEIENIESESNTLIFDIFPRNVLKAVFNKFNYTHIEFMFPCIGNMRSNEVPEPYAMIKPMGKNEIFIKNEKPKFKISLMLD